MIVFSFNGDSIESAHFHLFITSKRTAAVKGTKGYLLAYEICLGVILNEGKC